jgi:tetratricopeptide (TPR) repeat protein
VCVRAPEGDAMAEDDVYSLLAEANDLVDRGDHHGAIKLLERAGVAEEPCAGLNLGNSYVAIGDNTSAQKAFKTGWIAGCDDAGFNLAELYRQVGNVDRARIVYRRLIEKSYSKAMIAEAEALREDGDLAAAAELLARAIGEVSDVGDLAAGILGHYKWSSSRDLQAEALLRRGQATYPTARADLAALLRQTGREVEGVTVLQAGVACDESVSMLPLANILLSNGDVGAAETLYKRGYALGDAFAATNLAGVRWAAGRKKSARKWMKRAAAGGDLEAKAWLDETGPR